MNRNLKILLVEDDQEICKEIIDYINTISDTTLVGVTNNSDKAVEYLSLQSPDAVILDLELNEGTGSGIKFLQDCKYAANTLPYILVTTNNSSRITYDIVRKLGADYIMSKHQNDYTAATPVDFLRSLSDILISRNIQNSVAPSKEDEEQRKLRIKRKIAYELDKIGISQKAVGYNYLIDAIFIISNESKPNVCNEVANIYSKSESSVERAMQNAINRAWKTSDIEDLLVNYTAKIRSEKGVPTLTEFIYFYANKIKNGL